MDVRQEITNQIVAAIEAGAGKWSMPWHKSDLLGPINARTGRAFRGVNPLLLAIIADNRGYAARQWATFKQWLELGASVRKGEKGALIVFFKPAERPDPNAGDDDRASSYMVARASWVFNAEQVSGFEPDADELPGADFDINPILTRAVDALGLSYAEGGDRAYFHPARDHIQMPTRARFFDTPDLPAERAFAATLLHELIHATGAKSRLDRESMRAVTKHGYAFEELVADIGAAFLCRDLGISATLDDHHTQYVAAWLKILQSDKTAIFSAAAAASAAADYINERLRSDDRAAA